MSLFNTVVQPHEFAKILIFSLRWASPLDKKKEYPLLGRMRYAWMSEDYKRIKFLLKDGPQSWTEEEDRKELIDQITRHKSYISLTTVERDPVYTVAEFSIPTREDMIESFGEEFSDQIDQVQTLLENIAVIDQKFDVSITKDPFEIFDEQLELMKSLPGGVALNEGIAKLQDQIVDLFKNDKTE